MAKSYFGRDVDGNRLFAGLYFSPTDEPNAKTILQGSYGNVRASFMNDLQNSQDPVQSLKNAYREAINILDLQRIGGLHAGNVYFENNTLFITSLGSILVSVYNGPNSLDNTQRVDDINNMQVKRIGLNDVMESGGIIRVVLICLHWPMHNIGVDRVGKVIDKSIKAEESAEILRRYIRKGGYKEYLTLDVIKINLPRSKTRRVGDAIGNVISNPISRRQFLKGTAIVAGGAALAYGGKKIYENKDMIFGEKEAVREEGISVKIINYVYSENQMQIIFKINDIGEKYKNYFVKFFLKKEGGNWKELDYDNFSRENLDNFEYDIIFTIKADLAPGDYVLLMHATPMIDVDLVPVEMYQDQLKIHIE